MRWNHCVSCILFLVSSAPLRVNYTISMAKLPTVAIIGRPNTGKSTLFNRLYGRRKAIVSEIPGTTRDHIAGRIDDAPIPYLLVDTGGMGRGTEDKDLEADVHAQSLLALENADLILLTINSREDLTASDFEIADILRKKRKRHVPVILVPTKCDNPEEIDQILHQYYEFGVTDTVVPVSAPHAIGIDDLHDAIEENLKELNFKAEIRIPDPGSRIPCIAIIGKPNVGKSSIVNAFMSETQRKKSPLLVSSVPGTTRDAVDTVIRHEGREYTFIDTAGIARRSKQQEHLGSLAYLRSIRALEEADIAVLVLDAQQPVSKQDKRIAHTAIEDGKGLIILLNKIDLVKGSDRELAVEAAIDAFSFCRYAPLFPCSAQSQKELRKLFDLIAMVQQNRTRRIATKVLHDWFADVVYGKPLGTIAKSKHITQAEEVPPTFVLFVKNPKQVQVSQLRYLDNSLRKTFGFDGTPVRWVTKGAK